MRHAYGTSIPHLEPADVSTIRIPRLSSAVEQEIAAALVAASELRDFANDRDVEMRQVADDLLVRI